VALSAFADESHCPTPAEVRKVLGAAARQWAALIAHVRTLCTPVAEEWKFAGAKYGWSLRLKRKDRVLLYLTPQAGVMLVGVAIGEKALNAEQAVGKLSDRTLAVLDAAPKYAEGLGVRLAVATGDDLRVARELARIKIGR
jgi:hypothetical protein